MSEASNLSISPEKVPYLIIKAREFDAENVVTESVRHPMPVTDMMCRCWKTSRAIRSKAYLKA